MHISKLISGYVTIDGKMCLDSSPCDLHGESYFWCWTGKGEWDYCSLDRRYTTHGEVGTSMIFMLGGAKSPTNVKAFNGR